MPLLKKHLENLFQTAHGHGHMCPCRRLFAESVITAARSAAKFGTTIYSSFVNFFYSRSYQVRSPRHVNPRPAGPSPTPVLCWRGGGGAYRPPTISVTNRRGGKIILAMESPGRDLSDKVEKFDPRATCDNTGQVKHKMFDISI